MSTVRSTGDVTVDEAVGSTSSTVIAPARPAIVRGGKPIVLTPGPRELHPARSVKRDRWLTMALAIAVPVGLVLLWQAAAELGWIDVRFFPAPSTIMGDWRELIASGDFQRHLWASVRRILYGYVLGAGLGLFFGLLIGRTRMIKAALEPTIVAFYTTPKLAILPLLLLIFGIDETPKVLLIAITVFFIVLINTTGALESVALGHLEAGRSFGLNRVDMIRHVVLPSAMPQIFIGLRLAAGVAVLVVVGAEFVAAKAGVGYLIWNSWNIGIPSNMYIGIISISLLGVVTNSLLRLAQRVLVPWSTTH